MFGGSSGTTLISSSVFEVAVTLDFHSNQIEEKVMATHPAAFFAQMIQIRFDLRLIRLENATRISRWNIKLLQTWRNDWSALMIS